MRPRIEGTEETRLLTILNDCEEGLSPTELIKQLINKHYDTLYPRGEVTNGYTETSKERRD